MSFWILLLCAVAMVAAQDVLPGRPIYHYGWYNAICVALYILAAVSLRRRRSRGLLIAAFGGAVIVFAGIASGLMGPDAQTIVGAPGTSVRNDDVAGSFVFPLAQSKAPIVLQRGSSSVTIGAGGRYTGGFVMWQQPRTVVYVDAADAQGNHLTITQPTNSSFLSPVLLMQQSTTIAGMNLNYDTFSVPALRRNVKAVLFSEQQVAQLPSRHIAAGPAVLFAVSDTGDRPVPGGIGLIASGARSLIGGLLLRGTVGTYPAVAVASAPYMPILLVGFALLAAGAIMTLRSR